MASSSQRVVYWALICNVLVAIVKGVAAALTGSSAMLSEAIHGLVDTVNEFLLLYGQHRSTLQPDEKHPFGYGRELYFWSFVVALLVFVLGACVSFYEGVMHLMRPEPIRDPLVSYIVLGLSLVFEGISWIYSIRNFSRVKGDRSYWRAIRDSKDPPQFIVLLEDSGAIIGILLALGGTWASTAIDPRFDGIASILISVLLACIATVLARESKGLLIGEKADPALEKQAVDIAEAIDGVERVNGIFTAQMSPYMVIVSLSLQFRNDLTVVQLEDIVARLEAALKDCQPNIGLVFIKPQTRKVFEAGRQHWVGTRQGPKETA